MQTQYIFYISPQARKQGHHHRAVCYSCGCGCGDSAAEAAAMVAAALRGSGVAHLQRRLPLHGYPLQRPRCADVPFSL